ncbi:two-component system response regulator BaeR [Saccharobesus litoralis]|uniref:Two-component system response regulator BaeR n=1 Tax=Saccharobesus litoralis TaxID=2172099 RepID=A0A2S0VUV8_9ALTE|nr:response regulator [Saccharobesus litoralis]AWB68007.1 two-component system response regulator BaeR [Saccharobesus litoralis]
MAKILIVEDDIDIAQHVQLFLKAAEFETHHMASGAGVAEYVLNEKPDLVLLDIMLPVKDGIDCCRDIRSFSNVPVVMLTAKAADAERLTGLEVGADDYICKPFNAPELVMRIKAILRRTANNVHFSTITLDPFRQKVQFHDTDVGLTTLEFSLFQLLFNSPGRVYSRQQIVDLAYSDLRDVSERVVDSHIKNIRKRFKLAGCEEMVIESVYGAGYRYSS